VLFRSVITTSKTLAVRLAKLARNIRACINTVLAIETEDGPVTRLMAAFKEALCHRQCNSPQKRRSKNPHLIVVSLVGRGLSR
jgi:hypothetical protein